MMEKPVSRSREEKLAYQRGYQSGIAGRWPKELASSVPQPRVRDLAVASQQLQEAADGFMACFDDRDTDPAMVALDRAREVACEAIANLPNEKPAAATAPSAPGEAERLPRRVLAMIAAESVWDNDTVKEIRDMCEEALRAVAAAAKGAP
jgi:hypothetical protein